MFRRFMEWLKGGMYRMGLIRGLERLQDHKEIALNTEMYDAIDRWQDLYKGYHAPWHKVRFQTIEGPKERTMMTLGMAKAATSEMASLIFNEKCEISISDENLTKEIEAVLKHNRFHKRFQDYLEYSFAMGGMVIKPYFKNGRIKLSYVTADCFIPLMWENEHIHEGVFLNEFHKGDTKFVHLEWHQWDGATYVVRNEVYESQFGEELGKKVPLSDHFPDLVEEARIDGLEHPLFVYFKPNTANNIDTKSPLGISIFANAEHTMRAIDTAFDSFHREFRLGRKRIVVPAHMIKAVIDPQTGDMHRYFDASDETYEAFGGGDDESEIKDISATLRVDEHISAINALLNLFAMQTGFSPGTFTFDGQSMKTATEVVSEQSKTFKSKQSHEVIVEAGLQDLVDAIVAVAKLYNLFTAPAEYEVAVSFDDSIAEDKGAEIAQQIQLVSSQLTSRKKAIMKIHGVTEDEAEQLLQEIFEEERNGSPDYEEIQQQSVLFGAKE